ncbi:MAG: hypothetical protein GX621_12055 [Pirellulaceae bacterium]|nr:hypothetical protein [Pirellulaceae bacterium]
MRHGSVRADDGDSHAWWEAETRLDADSRLKLADKPWWPRARALAVGESFVVRSEHPDGGLMMVRRERWTKKGKPREAIVWVLDDDGDMKPDDVDGDKDSDCYVADYGADGVVDRMVDYVDNNGDGVADETEIRYFDKRGLRYGWFGHDLDGDGHIWNVTHYEYDYNFFLCDPHGDNLFYFNGYDAELKQWFPASECPFAFLDVDGDGLSEAVVRVSAVPLSFDSLRRKDCANDVRYSSAPRTKETRKIGVVNVRYSVDLDRANTKERPLHYDLGFNLIGRVPYRFERMESANPLRRWPKTTVCIPHEDARGLAESYPADQTGFSWHEFTDDTRPIGNPPHVDENRRWEGVFWTWERRVMHNTGNPTQKWNMRREFRPTPSRHRDLYYSRVDRRIHLKGATEGWIEIGHFGDGRAWGEIRTFDTNNDGYFDRWEVYRAGHAAPVRVVTVRDPAATDLSRDWDELSRRYAEQFLPEAREAHDTIMAALRRTDPTLEVPLRLAKALTWAPCEAQRRYIRDVLREEFYLQVRERLSARAGELLASDSTVGWERARRLARLDVAYGEGRYDEAARILDAIVRGERTPGEDHQTSRGE